MHLKKELQDIIDSDRDNEQEFIDLSESRKANAFNSWELVRDCLAPDPRYLSLSSDRKRRDVFQNWAKEKQYIPENTVSDAKSTYITFIRQNYTQGTPYPLFKRKFRANPEFANIELSDADKTNLYREFVMFTKMSEEEQKDFVDKHPHFSN